jgi:hypothetical protein
MLHDIGKSFQNHTMKKRKKVLFVTSPTKMKYGMADIIQTKTLVNSIEQTLHNVNCFYDHSNANNMHG